MEIFYIGVNIFYEKSLGSRRSRKAKSGPQTSSGDVPLVHHLPHDFAGDGGPAPEVVGGVEHFERAGVVFGHQALDVAGMELAGGQFFGQELGGGFEPFAARFLYMYTLIKIIWVVFTFIKKLCAIWMIRRFSIFLGGVEML